MTTVNIQSLSRLTTDIRRIFILDLVKGHLTHASWKIPNPTCLRPCESEVEGRFLEFRLKNFDVA